MLQRSQLCLELRRLQPSVGGPLRYPGSPRRVLDGHAPSERDLEGQFFASDPTAGRFPGSHLLNSTGVTQGSIEKITRDRIQSDETDRSCCERSVVDRSRRGWSKHNHRDGRVDGSDRGDDTEGGLGFCAVVNEQRIKEPIAESSEASCRIHLGNDVMIELSEELGQYFRAGPILGDE